VTGVYYEEYTNKPFHTLYLYGFDCPYSELLTHVLELGHGDPSDEPYGAEAHGGRGA
jgi:hypothetical protein